MATGDLTLPTLWMPVSPETSHLKEQMRKAGEESRKAYQEGMGNVGQQVGEGMLDGLKHADLPGGMDKIVSGMASKAGVIAGLTGAAVEAGISAITKGIEAMVDTTIEGVKASVEEIMKVGEAWEQVGHQLILTSAATGDAMEGLNRTAKEIASSGDLFAGFDKLGSTVGTLSTRLKTTNDEVLKPLATHLSDLNAVFGNTVSVDKFTQAMGMFKVNAGDADGVLASLTQSAQATSSDLGTIVDGLSQYGATLSAIFPDKPDQAGRFLGDLHLIGDDVGKVLAGFTKIETKAKDLGVPFADAVQQALTRLESITDPAKADEFAVSMFGGRNFASGKAAAEAFIRDLNTTTAQLQPLDPSGWLKSFLDAQETLSQKWTAVRTQLETAIAPVAELALKGITNALDTLSSNITKNQPQIVAKIKDIALKMVDALPTIRDFAAGAVEALGYVAEAFKVATIGVLYFVNGLEQLNAINEITVNPFSSKGYDDFSKAWAHQGDINKLKDELPNFGDIGNNLADKIRNLHIDTSGIKDQITKGLNEGVDAFNSGGNEVTPNVGPVVMGPAVPGPAAAGPQIALQSYDTPLTTGAPYGPAVPGQPGQPVVLGPGGSYVGIGATDNASTSSPKHGGIPGAPSGQGQDILSYMQSVMTGFNQSTGAHLTITADYPGGPHGHPDDGADHSVRRALDIGGSQADMDAFAAYVAGSPALLAATRQLIHNDPGNRSIGTNDNIIGGHTTSGYDTYAPWMAGHADHDHWALQYIPPGAPGAAAPALPSAPGAAPSGSNAAQVSALLTQAGVPPDVIKLALAMNTREGGDTNASSVLGFMDKQASGIPAKVAAFLRQLRSTTSESGREKGPGGQIPGFDAQGNLTDPVAAANWMGDLVGQHGAGRNGSAPDFNGDVQPDPAVYRADILANLRAQVPATPPPPRAPFIGPTVQTQVALKDVEFPIKDAPPPAPHVPLPPGDLGDLLGVTPPGQAPPSVLPPGLAGTPPKFDPNMGPFAVLPGQPGAPQQAPKPYGPFVIPPGLNPPPPPPPPAPVIEPGWPGSQQDSKLLPGESTRDYYKRIFPNGAPPAAPGAPGGPQLFGDPNASPPLRPPFAENFGPPPPGWYGTADEFRNDSKGQHDAAQRVIDTSKALADAIQARLDLIATGTATTKQLDDAQALIQTKMQDKQTAMDDQVTQSMKMATDRAGKPAQQDKSQDSMFQQLGSGLLKGVGQELGFGDVFGKAPWDWGAVKLLTGAAGWGINLANTWSDMIGAGKTNVTGYKPLAGYNRSAFEIGKGAFPSLFPDPKDNPSSDANMAPGVPPDPSGTGPGGTPYIDASTHVWGNSVDPKTLANLSDGQNAQTAAYYQNAGSLPIPAR